MAGVIRTAIVVFGILWLVSSLAPDAPRVEIGSRPVTVKMRSVRQVLFVVGALGAGVWYAMRRDRKAAQPGVTVTHSPDSPAVFRAEATPVGEPPVVTVTGMSGPLKVTRRGNPRVSAGLTDDARLADEMAAWDAASDEAWRGVEAADDSFTDSSAPASPKGIFCRPDMAQAALNLINGKDAANGSAQLPPRQSVEHRLDVHEGQIQELTQRMDARNILEASVVRAINERLTRLEGAGESPAPKPPRKKPANKTGGT